MRLRAKNTDLYESTKVHVVVTTLKLTTKLMHTCLTNIRRKVYKLIKNSVC